MPNPWTGKGNSYTKQEVRDRLQATVDQNKAIIAAGAGTGISAKFIEKGGADLIIIYNSGRFRMSGHGSTAGLMSYGDAIIAHVETTVGGSIGVTGASCTMDFAIERTQSIIKTVQKANPDTFFLAHGGPINTLEDVRYILEHTGAHGFVGASSLERMAIEQSLTNLTREFKALTLSRK